jgi:NAD(P)-dependent dehydrogenase (short-subunit alcohol dehydrogenase family)
MNEKVCLITGANAGIGKEAAVQLAGRGCRVVLGCRNEERGLRALDEVRELAGSDTVELLQVDMSSRSSIRGAVLEITGRHTRIDVVIHNAADFDISRKAPAYSEDGIETVWATNHIGPALMTGALLPALGQSPQGRILTVASQGLAMHPLLKIRMEDPEFRNARFRVDKAYYHSKLAQVMYTYGMAGRLQGGPITINCVRVTNVKIDIARYPNISAGMKRVYALKSRFSISPAEMAQAYVRLALDEEYGPISGGYFDEKCREVSSSAYSRNPETIAALMKLTEEYLEG